MGIIDGIGKAIKVLQKSGQIEIISELIDTQQKVLEMQEDYMRLKAENEKLKDTKDIQADLVITEHGSYRKSEIAKKVLYCSACWGNNQKLIPLITSKMPGAHFNAPICPTCKAIYAKGNPFAKMELAESDQEEKIEYNTRGYFIIKGENPRIPYCSACWKLEKKTVPLAQQDTVWKYKCSNCKTNIVALDDDGNPLNKKKEAGEAT